MVGLGKNALKVRRERNNDGERERERERERADIRNNISKL